MLRRSLFVVAACFASTASAADWPMWRHDAGRTAASPSPLPKELHLQWVRRLPAPRPAWPASQAKLQFDASYEPVVAGRRMFVGSMVDDSLRAYSTADGRELWRFYTDGPVRFAPLAVDGRVFAVSDDGHLYCLETATGKLNWKVNGGPRIRPIIGNHRLVSTWPARGGPVYADGTVYFAASIWPSMGIFIHAVDAKTGRKVWTNSETGSKWVVHPHGAPSFGSIVPQGHLVVNGDALIVPGGRSTPAVFDRKTGKPRQFNFDRRAGHHRVATTGEYYFVAGNRYAVKDGAAAGAAAVDAIAGGATIAGVRGKITGTEIRGTAHRRVKRDRRGKIRISLEFSAKKQWEITTTDGSPTKVHLVAGNQLYTANGGLVARFAIPVLHAGATEPVTAKQAADWSAKVDGDVWTMLAADDRLFVVTTDGAVICFGQEKRQPKRFGLPGAKPQAVVGESTAKLVRDVMAACAIESRTSRAKIAARDPAFVVVMGIGDRGFVDELVNRANVHAVVVDPSAKRVDAFRRNIADAGVYGIGVAAHVGDGTFPFPPYFTSALICLDHATAGIELSADSVAKLFGALRPYGGTMCLPLSARNHAVLAKAVKSAGLLNAELSRVGAFTLLKRVGPLPKSAGWTHQYGDAANSVVSNDELVKAPLGVLWFGGPSNDKVLPRHGHGPNPQVAGGRLVIEGADMLRAVDVYTGRRLWETELKGVGSYYNVTRHFAGAGEVGSNYVTLPDAVYVVYGTRIIELDAETGKERRSFALTPESGKPAPQWGYACVSGRFLVATSSPVEVAKAGKKSSDAFEAAEYASASKRIVVFDRKSGKLLWQRDAEFTFRHNCVIAAAGKVFCIDGLSPTKIQLLKRRGINASSKAKLLALDAKSGKVLWSTDENVFGTFLNYSKKHDVLLQAGSAYRDRAKDEVSEGMVAYRGKDGKVLWKDLQLRYGGPCLLWKDKIITNGGGGFQLELLTGRKTGWSYSRMYGCNTAVGCQNLLTFRSGAAGFYDLTHDSGTGNIGGFKSGCTSNLIAADGVLNAPDYTRTCTCAYQNQTSLALIHMPENEFWTFNRGKFDASTAKRIGLNLGAPGDRRSADGTLWFDVPSVGGPSPDVSVKTEPESIRWFQRHSSVIRNGGLDWVAASGAEGIRKLKLKLKSSKTSASRFTVRLYFAEPGDVKPGQRVFSVAIQGTTVLSAFDVVRAAGGTNRLVVKEFPNVSVDGTLEVTLDPASGSTRPPLLCGVELIRTK
jgi:outer membrane protein assembly factor BamB